MPALAPVGHDARYASERFGRSSRYRFQSCNLIDKTLLIKLTNRALKTREPSWTIPVNQARQQRFRRCRVFANAIAKRATIPGAARECKTLTLPCFFAEPDARRAARRGPG